MTVLIPLILLVLVALATRFGSDSRDGRDWATGGRSGCSGNIVLR